MVEGGGLLDREQIALYVMHAILGDAFVLRCARSAWVHQRAVVLSQLAVRLGQLLVLQRRPQHRRLEIVDHQLPGHAPEALKGALVAADPGIHPLVEDKLHILVPGVGERHHKAVGLPQPPGSGVSQLAGAPEVHLGALAWGHLQAHYRLFAPRSEVTHEAAHGTVGADVTVVAAQPLMHRHHLHPLMQQALHHLPIGLHTRHIAAGQ
ncbi:MAG: hypothetical protein MUQ26_01720 [Armatimonadetes bacterium]|nr:hypothetical protein [Armatimonadota bacterium]